MMFQRCSCVCLCVCVPGNVHHIKSDFNGDSRVSTRALLRRVSLLPACVSFAMLPLPLRTISLGNQKIAPHTKHGHKHLWNNAIREQTINSSIPRVFLRKISKKIEEWKTANGTKWKLNRKTDEAEKCICIIFVYNVLCMYSVHIQVYGMLLRSTRNCMSASDETTSR